MYTPGFAILTSLLMAIISIRTLYVVARSWRQLFDQHFTPAERQLVSQAAFFLLLPLSVPLHEAGHAVAVKLFGGQITGYGWYVFYGFVEYVGVRSASAVFWIALAGNLVSVALGAAAIAVALFRPRRAAINYLLLVFGALSILNALVFYPLLDLIGGFEGDWSQIYSGRTPALSLGTAIAHGAILLAMLLVWRSDRFRRLYAERTGLRPDAMRRVSRAQAADELLSAGEQLSASWRHPLRVVAEAPENAAGVSLHWISNGYGRVVAAVAVLDGQRRIELYGGLKVLDGSGRHFERPLGYVQGIPAPDQVTPALVRALDLVDAWDARTVEQPIEG
ncbi:MAG TPA: hypothetical protein VFU72_14275 [Nitrolancea sp.]|nr:hypothetical protein [Nitrolancea sp.]